MQPAAESRKNAEQHADQNARQMNEQHIARLHLKRDAKEQQHIKIRNRHKKRLQNPRSQKMPDQRQKGPDRRRQIAEGNG